MLAWRPAAQFAEGSKPAIAGALLAAQNTASEYGFGGVIAALPGFRYRGRAQGDPESAHERSHYGDQLAGITGSASGGLSIALAAMSDHVHRSCRSRRNSARSPASRRVDGERRHGYAAAQRRRDYVAGRHRTDAQAYKDIFVITFIKTAAVFVVIGVFYLTGIY